MISVLLLSVGVLQGLLDFMEFFIGPRNVVQNLLPFFLSKQLLIVGLCQHHHAFLTHRTGLGARRSCCPFKGLQIFLCRQGHCLFQLGGAISLDALVDHGLAWVIFDILGLIFFGNRA